MPSTSTYVQLSNYALVEYVYESEIITTTTARTLRLKNGYTEQYQFVNASSAVNLTGNVLDRSASRLGLDSTRWAYHDIDAAVPTIQTDANFTLTDVTTSLTTNQKYDTVKVHLAAGYDFPGIDGFIVEIQWEEWTALGSGGRRFTAGAQVYIKSEQTVNFNPNPLFLGDRFYDRYVEFKVPSLADTNTDFWNSPTASNTIGYQYTFNNVGFLQSSQIFTNIYEIDLTTETNGNRFFQVGNVYRSSFNAADQYSYIGCVVKENTEYDYMEYYPTFYNGFIEDYIADLNSGQNGDWVVINQINVYEQAGTTMIRTSSNTLLQEDNFNEPAIFRPVIRNAAYVYSFTVEYIMRMMNKVDNTEIVRKSTVTSSSPKKYGYSLEKINVLEGFRPVKVYNKIEKIESTTIQNSITAQEGAFGWGTPKVITQNLYVNNYYDVNNISVDSTTNVGDIIGTMVYPQGMNYIFINKFDNYVKFKVFSKSADKKTNVTFDFAATGMNVKLAFIFDDDSKVYLDATQDLTAANPGAGELLFKIDDILSTKLLKGKNRDYYIINKNDKNDEVLIYAGKFESQDKKTEIMAKINQNMITELNAQIAKLKKAQEALTRPVIKTVGTVAASTETAVTGATGGASPATTPAAQTQEEKIKVIEQASAFVANTTKGIDNAIKQAAAESNKENPIVIKLNIPEIPGVTPGLGAPISLSISPAVTQPSKPRSGGTFYQRFIKGKLEQDDIANTLPE
jgi:hypothetical protein